MIVLKVQPLGGVERALEPGVSDPGCRRSFPRRWKPRSESPPACRRGRGPCPSSTSPAVSALFRFSPATWSSIRCLPVNGEMELRRPEPDPALLDRFAADRDTSAELLRRLRWAAEVLT